MLAGPEQAGAGFVVNVMARIEDTERARNRWWSTRAAWVVLAAIAGAFLLARPWAGVDREMLRLGSLLVAGTLGLALFAAVVSYVVRTYVDDHSPVTEFVALLLVLLPGLTGVILTLGFLGRLQARAAGMLGALAALAVAICVVNFYELFPFLDSML